MCEYPIKFEDTICEQPIKFENTQFELGLLDAKRLSMMLAPTQQPFECLTRTFTPCIVLGSWFNHHTIWRECQPWMLCFLCVCGWIIISISTAGVDLRVPRGWEAQLPTPLLGIGVQRRSFVLVRPLLDVFTWYFEFQSVLSCDLCFHWNAQISCQMMLF